MISAFLQRYSTIWIASVMGLTTLIAAILVLGVGYTAIASETFVGYDTLTKAFVFGVIIFTGICTRGFNNITILIGLTLYMCAENVLVLVGQQYVEQFNRFGTLPDSWWWRQFVLNQYWYVAYNVAVQLVPLCFMLYRIKLLRALASVLLRFNKTVYVGLFIAQRLRLTKFDAMMFGYQFLIFMVLFIPISIILLYGVYYDVAPTLLLGKSPIPDLPFLIMDGFYVLMDLLLIWACYTLAAMGCDEIRKPDLECAKHNSGRYRYLKIW